MRASLCGRARRWFAFIALFLLSVVAAAQGEHGGGGHGGGHGAGHGRAHFGGHFVGGHGGGHAFLGLGYWPWYYAPPWYYYPPAAGTAYRPPVYYVERGDEQAAQPGYWYYCANPQGYYPYLTQCPGGWQRVRPQPPP